MPPRVRYLGASGPITKQGSRLARWAAIEAIGRQRSGSFLQGDYHRIAQRRANRNIARVAAFFIASSVKWS